MSGLYAFIEDGQALTPYDWTPGVIQAEIADRLRVPRQDVRVKSLDSSPSGLVVSLDLTAAEVFG